MKSVDDLSRQGDTSPYCRLKDEGPYHFLPLVEIDPGRAADINALSIQNKLSSTLQIANVKIYR